MIEDVETVVPVTQEKYRNVKLLGVYFWVFHFLKTGPEDKISASMPSVPFVVL